MFTFFEIKFPQKEKKLKISTVYIIILKRQILF